MKEFKSGYIHSIETMGLVDGPNIRVVIFMQGCPLRCIFCHNPETWDKISKNKMTSKEIVDEVRKYRSYIELGGGVTFSGGEPLYQSEFLLEMLKMCKKAGIHTCIDTSGTGYDKKYLNEILKYTDLVILDIKAIDDINYKKITGKKVDEFEYFKEQVINNKGLTVVDFWAPWCGPCKLFGPIFENVSVNYDNIKFCKLNVDEDETEISKEFGVMSIPTVILFKDGKEIKRNIGFMDENSLIEFLEVE